MKPRSTLQLLSLFALTLLFGATKSFASPPVIMKVLVLAGSTSEQSYQSITTYLAQIGVPYQGVALNSVTPDSSGNRLSKVPLSNSATGQGLYQGIILTDSRFAACTPSCMSTADWTTLNTYAAQFSVRIASYYTYPAAQWGLLPADSGVNYTAANPLNVTLTSAGAAVFPYLNSANAIAIAGQGTSGIKAYRATTTTAANETTTPLLTAGAYTVAATHTLANGQQILALTMDNNPTLIHSMAFGYGVINWVTNGIFLGSRKVYLNPEIDDFLLGNWLYAPSQHPGCEDDNSCPTYFETAPDLQALANWQTALRADPQFQGYRTTFAFNGVGTTWFDSSDPIWAAIRSLSSQFWWVSHTWDHPNLDCYSTNSRGACVAATLAQSLSELNQNISVAPTIGIPLDVKGMVTPFNSGLSNSQFLQAAAQLGTVNIVFPALPSSPNTPIVNTLNPSIVEITRLNNDCFDDVSSPLSGVYGSWPDEYNDTYGPNGTTPMYSQNQTYSQILDIVSGTFLSTNLLSYAPYPIEFHIAETATYDGTNSIFSDLMNKTISKYKKVFTLPVVSINIESIGALLTARAKYNASGVVGVYTPGVSVVLTTTNAAAIPLTGLCSQGACGTYGGQIQDSVTMAANSTITIPLNTNVGVALSSVAVSPASVAGGTPTTGTVTLSGPAPTGGVSVSLASNNAAVTVPASVLVAAGNSSATFTVTTGSVASTVSATLTASYSGVSQTAGLTVTPATAVALSSIAVVPASVTGGTSASGTVTLTSAAPAGGVSVSLSSNSAAATVPSSVSVAAGSTTASFTVSTTAVTSSTSASLTATYNGVNKSAPLTVTPATSVVLSSVSLNPSSVASYAASTGTVSLSGAAPAGGLVVSLSSSNSAAAVPASVTVTAGNTSATFAIATVSVPATTTVTITATSNGVSKTATLTVTPAAAVALSSVSVNPTSVVNQNTATGTVTISAPAPAGGIVVALWTTGTVAYVPESVTIPAGSSTASFTIITNYTNTTLQDTVTAFYNGASKTAGITVTP